jgi:hypothetical protein
LGFGFGFEFALAREKANNAMQPYLPFSFSVFFGNCNGNGIGYISYSNNSTKYLSGNSKRAISFSEELMLMLMFMFRVSSSLGREKRSLVEISQFRFGLHPGNWVPVMFWNWSFSRVFKGWNWMWV